MTSLTPDIITPLPYEIKDIISSYLDTHSFINFTKTNKQNSFLNNENIWKKKICIDYPLFFKDNGKIKDYKKLYIKYHKTLCIECNKKTTLYNDFFNVKLCRPCEKSFKKYEMITKKKAMNYFFLSPDEFINFKFIKRPNPYHHNRPLKLYLKSDIVYYIKHKQVKLINNPTYIKRRDKTVKMINKHVMITNILNSIYNISHDDMLINIFPNVNEYTNNLYIRYVKYNTVSDKKNNLQKVINACIELNFIKKYTTLSISNFQNFDELLFYFLINNKDVVLSFNINFYIDNKIFKCYKENKEIFNRKLEMFRLLNSSKIIKKSNYFSNHIVFKYIWLGKEAIKQYHYNNYNINAYLEFKTKMPTLYNTYIRGFQGQYLYDYILYRGSNLLQNIKDIVELEYFLYSNTNLSNVIFFTYINNVELNRFTLYTRVFYKWYINNPSLRYKIPVNLYKFILH